MTRSGIVVGAMVLASCAPLRVSVPVADDADYAFVLMGPDGIAIARVITPAAQCPAVEVDSAMLPMQVRMAPATVPLRPTRSKPALSKPSAFPVLSCELQLPPHARHASVDGRSLPLPKANPQRIVVIGDTGCRIKRSDHVFQNCDNPALWPFEMVSEAAAAKAPDLVIHVGDFHYRENACPMGDGGCAGSPWGYGWDAWSADLFHPARKLFAAAPWIVVRGNHESCNRAGQGWWRFLDPRPVASEQNCNDPRDDDVGNYSEPYAVPLGDSGDMRFIVFDSSWVGLTPIRPPLPAFNTWRRQFEEIFARTATTPQTIFISHNPVLGFASNPRHPDQPFPGNATLQSVLEVLYPQRYFPANVEALLSGHNHLLEIVTFKTPHPPQIISGNAGDWADEAFPVPFPAGATPAPGSVVADVVSNNRFGFMTLDRDGDGWQLRAWDPQGNIGTECVLRKRDVRCSPDAVPR